MESMQSTLDQLTEDFYNKMNDFQEQLQNKSGDPTSISMLSSEFSIFKTFITQTLDMLQKQMTALHRTVDNMEMHSRRKMLLLHGVEEAKDENTAALIADVIKKRCGLSEFTVGNIKRCQRLGRPSSAKRPRPILIKLQDMVIRNKVWYNKNKLKGTGITLSEFLTKTRHDVFMAARDRFGVSKCWSREGTVIVMGPGDMQHRVATLRELRDVADRPPEAAATVNVSAPKTTATRAKRAVTTSKK